MGEEAGSPPVHFSPLTSLLRDIRRLEPCCPVGQRRCGWLFGGQAAKLTQPSESNSRTIGSQARLFNQLTQTGLWQQQKLQQQSQKNSLSGCFSLSDSIKQLWLKSHTLSNALVTWLRLVNSGSFLFARLCKVLVAGVFLPSLLSLLCWFRSLQQTVEQH